MVFLTRALFVRRFSRQQKIKLKDLSQWSHPLYGSEQTPVEGRMKGLMKGLYPVTRTREYLRQGIVFRDCVKVMTINYGNYEDGENNHEGIRDVINMNLQQLRYSNPNVHIDLIENLTPTPYITFYLDSGDKFHVDVDGKEQFEILTHLQKVIGKPKRLLEQEMTKKDENPANFGRKFSRKCICEVEGQVPCSSKQLEPGYARALHGKNINLNPKKYVFGKEE
uniref:28S ribosomal protein S25, mitochondrial-like n=1 Tax=Styela clava TaxID=7725 RepID=UPI001939D5C8|nr:28S ribosomal protein S25, mitochondrial-like [Styela clava]